MKLLFLTFLAFLWFFAAPIWDMLFNHSKQNTAEVHWFTQTTLGQICFVIGGILAIVQSIRFFIPKKVQGKGLTNPTYKLPCDR